MEKKITKNILLISLGYLPTVGGSYRVLHELIIRNENTKIDVLTCKDVHQDDFDLNQNYTIKRSAFISILNEDALIFGNFSTRHFNKLLFFRLLIKFFKYLILPFLSFLFIMPNLLNKKYHIIIFAQSVLPFAWYINIIKKISNKKVICFVYGEDIVSYRKKGEISKLLRKIYLSGLKKSDTIIANSNITKQEIIDDGIIDSKIKIIYPAVDYNFFKLSDKIKAKENFNVKDKFVILSVGRLIRRKGFDTVLDILPKLIEHIPNLFYIIRGEGYDKLYLQEKIANNKIEKYVRFIDDLPYSELPKLYSASDLFVLPNRLDEKDNEQEGFGIVFLEANACGIPVIGGNSGGVKDVITNNVNGILINPLDLFNLNKCIVDVYYKERVFDSIFIREFVKNKYNWELSRSGFLNAIELNGKY